VKSAEGICGSSLIGTAAHARVPSIYIQVEPLIHISPLGEEALYLTSVAADCCCMKRMSDPIDWWIELHPGSL